MPRPDHVRPESPPRGTRRGDSTPAAPAPAEDVEEVVDPDAVYDPPGELHPGSPGMARAAATVIGHTGSWAAGTYLRAGRRMVGVVLAPSSGLELARDVAQETSRVLHAVAEADQLDDVGPAGTVIKRAAAIAGSLLPVRAPRPAVGPPDGADRRQNHNGHIPTLREQGEELLRRSRDVNDTFDTHPAYARILSEMAPDEARILQLMLIDGPQPTVDVRTGGPLGLINSRLIEPGLSMIGARAGCRYPDRVPSYLNNLFRLGLIWFSQETLRDHQRYQVLEAQPDVLAAIHSVTAAKLVRRSVHLTPFGEDLCRFSFSDGVDPDRLPEHSAPKQLDTVPRPPAETIDG